MGYVKDVLAAIGTSLIVSQATDLVPFVSAQIVRWSAARLGSEGEQYREAWLADQKEAPGKLVMACWAMGTIQASFVMLPPIPTDLARLKSFARVHAMMIPVFVAERYYRNQLKAKYGSMPDDAEPETDFLKEFDTYVSLVTAISALKIASLALRQPRNDIDLNG